MEALSPPKQERATAKGMVQFITPNTWSANVWKEKIKRCQSCTWRAEVRSRVKQSHALTTATASLSKIEFIGRMV